ncbi:MAG TPA: hypothetical protein VGD94_15375 [Vicinamibacterales bacterium]
MKPAAGAAPAPPQTSWTLDQARVARGKLAEQNSTAARRALELIDLAFPTLAAEAAAQRSATAAPAMPSMKSAIDAHRAGAPAAPRVVFPEQPAVDPATRAAARHVSRPDLSAPPMDFNEAVRKRAAKK